MNVQLIPEPFVEIPVELADEMEFVQAKNQGHQCARHIRRQGFCDSQDQADDDRRQKGVPESVCRSIKASGASLRTKDEMIERLRTCFRQR